MAERSDPVRMIAFQGAPGAYSDLACRHVFPEMTSLPCPAFEDAFAAVREERARLAMMPIENSVAGRVGWRAVGARTDTVGGRVVTTVLYADRRGRRIGYSIVAGSALAIPAGNAMVVRRGRGFHVLS